jgi:hypothetical protein
MKKAKIINRDLMDWMNSKERKFIVDMLTGIANNKKELLEELQNFEAYQGGTLEEWKQKRFYVSIPALFTGDISRGDLWKLLNEEQRYFEDVILRGDAGEDVSSEFQSNRLDGKRGRKRDGKKWNEVYRITRLYLNEQRHMVTARNGRVSKNKLSKIVSEKVFKNYGFEIAAKTIFNNYNGENCPPDIRKKLSS